MSTEQDICAVSNNGCVSVLASPGDAPHTLRVVSAPSKNHYVIGLEFASIEDAANAAHVAVRVYDYSIAEFRSGRGWNDALVDNRWSVARAGFVFADDMNVCDDVIHLMTYCAAHHAGLDIGMLQQLPIWGVVRATVNRMCVSI